MNPIICEKCQRWVKPQALHFCQKSPDIPHVLGKGERIFEFEVTVGELSDYWPYPKEPKDWARARAFKPLFISCLAKKLNNAMEFHFERILCEESGKDLKPMDFSPEDLLKLTQMAACFYESVDWSTGEML